MSSTNFQIWNPSQNNMETDLQYTNDTMRLNGAVSGIYPSDLHNKMMFQVTTFLKAFTDSLVNQGYTLNDSNYVNLVNAYSTLVNTQGSKMTGALEFADPETITSVSGVLSLTNTSNTFIVNGSETITTITSSSQLSQGWYLITWNTTRTLTNSSTLKLLNNSNRTTAIGDTGIYQIVSNGAATPIYTVTELFYQQFSAPGSLVAEIDIGSATTSITFNGLGAVSAGGYILTGNVVNTSISASNYFLYVNGDTTMSNYKCQQAYSINTTLTGLNANEPTFVGGLLASNTASFVCNIEVTPNNIEMYSSNSSRTDGYTESIMGYRTISTTDITSLTITTDISNAIGIGSRFRIYRRI